MKTAERQEFLIAGYTKGQGRRASSLGALVLAVRRGGDLVWAGNCGTGFDERRSKLLRQAAAARADDAPVRAVPKMPRVRRETSSGSTPKLVCEVEFAEWTHDGRLRAPVYQGLREDKSRRVDVRRELPLETEIKRGRKRFG